LLNKQGSILEDFYLYQHLSVNPKYRVFSFVFGRCKRFISSELKLPQDMIHKIVILYAVYSTKHRRGELFLGTRHTQENLTFVGTEFVIINNRTHALIRSYSTLWIPRL